MKPTIPAHSTHPNPHAATPGTATNQKAAISRKCPTSPRPNQALKLTRLLGCLPGQAGSGEDRGVRGTCPSAAVQLRANVRQA